MAEKPSRFSGVCLGLLWAVVLALPRPLMAQPLMAQPPARAEGERPAALLPRAAQLVQGHLERADAYLANAQWDEALGALRQASEQEPDAVLRAEPAPAGPFTLWQPVRTRCQVRLTEIFLRAPAARAGYRQRVDRQAERWLRQGLEQRDDRLLIQIVDQFFGSSFTDDALLALGEGALERGAPTRARAYWEMLSPWARTQSLTGSLLGVAEGYPLAPALRGLEPAAEWKLLGPSFRPLTAAPSWPVYPDADWPVEQVFFRLALASTLEGDLERAELETELLALWAPAAAGRLAGREGKLSELAQQFQAAARTWPAVPPPQDWGTFAGDAARQRLLARELLNVGPPAWIHALSSPPAAASRQPTPPRRQEEPATRPLLVSGQVLIADPSAVTLIRSFASRSGKVLWPAPSESDPQRELPAADPAPPRSHPLAVEGHLAFVLASSTMTLATSPSSAPVPQDRLLALDLAAEGRLRWDLTLAPPEWEGSWEFAGAPVTEPGRLYSVLRRIDGVRSDLHVACFDTRRGGLLWRRFVGAAAELRPMRPVTARPELLLTLHEGQVFLNSHAGFIAALRMQDGQLQWIMEYPRATLAEIPLPSPARRVPGTPCLAFRDLVICAPADCDRLFALDFATGGLRWSALSEQAVDVRHLLGVAGDYLLASGEQLYWFQVHSGRLLYQFPGPRRQAGGLARSSPHGSGRGLVSRRSVLWPTDAGLYLFATDLQATPSGLHPRLLRIIDLQRWGLLPGNLIAGAEHLFLANDQHLVALPWEATSASTSPK